MKMPHFPIVSWKANKKYNLENIATLLNALDNPHLKLPPIIHVAGTNGKGSSVAMLKSILMCAGYKVHAYTSPHLLEFNERIILAGEKISDYELWQVCEHVRLASIKTKVEPLFFEGTTVAAFLAFASHKADILILETGIGGRLDATNIITNPLITLITSISYDHIDRLGSTLPLIAQEKAGIIKKKVPCVISMQIDEVYKVLFDKAAELGSPAYAYEHDFAIQKSANGFIYLSKNFTYEFPTPALLGDHQLINAASSIAVISLINEQFKISNNLIAEGLTKVEWPGRIQKIDPERYKKLAGSNIQIWVDGAHNSSGAQVLSTWAHENLTTPIYLIIGMTKNRDVQEFCSYFVGLTVKACGVKVLSEPLSHSAEVISQEGAKTGIYFVASESLEQAITEINNLCSNNIANIIITGSLFLVADVFKLIY